MSVTSDYDFLVAMSRALSKDDTLFAMVDGKFEIDFPAKNVSANIDDGNETMISVSLPNVVTKAQMGYDAHGLVWASGMFQIDVASVKGNNSKYCRDVANAIKVLIEGDIVEVLDTNYIIYIDRVNDNTFFDEEITAWHAALIVYGYYLKNSK